MDPPELALHSFVAKAWLEDLASVDRPAVLGRHITPVLSGERRHTAVPRGDPGLPHTLPRDDVRRQAAPRQTAVPPSSSRSRHQAPVLDRVGHAGAT